MSKIVTLVLSVSWNTRQT